MNNLIIRPAEISDVDVLSAVAKKSFIQTYQSTGERPEGMVEDYANVTYAVEKIREGLNDKRISFFLAECEGSVVGYSKLEDCPPPAFVRQKNLLHLAMIYLLASHHGKGIGSMLLNRNLEESRTRRRDGVWLGVWDQNRNAIAFYKKLGFQLVGSHDWKFKYRDYDYVDTDLVFTKTI